MKKVYPLLLTLLLLISWAAYLPPRVKTEDPPATTASSMASVPVCETTPAPAAVCESENPTDTTDTPEKERLESAESETTLQKETRPSADPATGSTQPTVPTPTQDPTNLEKTPPRQTEPPKETQPLVTEPPTQPTDPVVIESEPTEPVIPETEPAAPPETEPKETEATEPQFDIGYWIGYAKSYAARIGLRLESSAVDCWDNPIRAGSHCTYLERDIQSRLNRYAKDGDITDVWIWAEDRGDGTYDLYIGYA